MQTHTYTTATHRDILSAQDNHTNSRHADHTHIVCTQTHTHTHTESSSSSSHSYILFLHLLTKQGELPLITLKKPYTCMAIALARNQSPPLVKVSHFWVWIDEEACKMNSVDKGHM